MNSCKAGQLLLLLGCFNLPLCQGKKGSHMAWIAPWSGLYSTTWVPSPVGYRCPQLAAAHHLPASNSTHAALFQTHCLHLHTTGIISKEKRGHNCNLQKQMCTWQLPAAPVLLAPRAPPPPPASLQHVLS